LQTKLHGENDLRQKLFDQFWSLGNRIRQWEYLANCCEKIIKRRITTENDSKRKFTIRYNHAIGERVILIPKARCLYDLPLSIPIYYRDYNNPDAFPAYFMICHYAYVKVTPDIAMCGRCVTDEHTFCIYTDQSQCGDTYILFRVLSNTPTCIAVVATDY